MNSWLRTVFGQEIICFDNVSGRMWAGGRAGVFLCDIFRARCFYYCCRWVFLWMFSLRENGCYCFGRDKFISSNFDRARITDAFILFSIRTGIDTR